MKKTLHLFSLTILILAIFLGMTLSVDALMYKNYIVKYDFDTAVVGSGSFQMNNNEDGYINIDEEIFNDTKSVKAGCDQATATTMPYVRINTPKLDYKKYVFKGDFYFPQGSTNGISFNPRFGKSNDANKDVTALVKLTNSKVYINGAEKSTYSDGFNSLEISIDFNSNTVGLKINNSFIGQDTFTSDAVYIKQFRLAFSPGDDAVGYYCLDNIELYTEGEGPSFNSSSAQNVSHTDDKISFKLNGNLKFDTLLNSDALTLSDGSGNIEISEINIDSAAENIFTITPKYNLDTSTLYTISINPPAEVFAGTPLVEPVRYSFTTAVSTLEASNASYSVSGNNVIFTVDLNIASGENVSIISTVWNGDNLVSTKADSYISSSFGVQHIIPGVETGFTVTTLIVDDLNNPVRVGKPYYKYVK